MKCSILTVIVLSSLASGAAQAQELQTVPVAPAPTPTPGAPGTPTPTLYPQVTPPALPKTNGSPLLAPIVLPTPPKDQTVPGLQQNDSKPKAPGG